MRIMIIRIKIEQHAHDYKLSLGERNGQAMHLLCKVVEFVEFPDAKDTASIYIAVKHTLNPCIVKDSS